MKKGKRLGCWVLFIVLLFGTICPSYVMTALGEENFQYLIPESAQVPSFYEETGSISVEDKNVPIYFFTNAAEKPYFRVYGSYDSKVGFYGCNERGELLEPITLYDQATDETLRGSGVGEAMISNGGIVTNVQVDQIDGTEEFDADSEPGNDDGPNNGIVRSFDSIFYTVAATMAVNDGEDGPDGAKNVAAWSGGVLYAKAEISENMKDVAAWDVDAISKWAEIVELSEDGLTITVSYQMAQDKVTIPGRQSLNLPLNIYGAANGMKVKPTFTMWLEGNQSDKVVKKLGSETTVSASPSYNVAIKRNEALERKITTSEFGINNQQGRLYGYGIGLQLAGSSTRNEKSLKGIEFPSGEITFDLDLSLIKNGEEEITDTVIPRIWNYNINGETADTTYPKRSMNWGVNTQLCSNMPAGKGGQHNSVYDSGRVSMAQDELNPSIIHVTISDYRFNGSFPNHFQQTSDESLPSDIRHDIGYFAVDYVQFFVPFEENEEENLGTYEFWVEDTNFSAYSISGNKVTAQANTEDDAAAVQHVRTKGTGYMKANYIYGNNTRKALNPLYLDSSRGFEYARLGQIICPGTFVASASSDPEAVNSVVMLSKFDDEALEPAFYDGGEFDGLNQSEYSLSADGAWIRYRGDNDRSQSMDFRMLYAVKKDGSGWASDKEMYQADIEDLEYYDTYEEWLASGKVCVGMLFESDQSKGKNGIFDIGGKILINYYMKVKETARVDEVYPICNRARLWYDDIDKEQGWSLSRDTQAPDVVLFEENEDYDANYYSKTQYNLDGSVIRAHLGAKGSSWPYWYGNSLLVVGATAQIKKVAYDSDKGTQMLVDKDSYDLGTGDTTISYAIIPEIVSSKQLSGTETTTATITDVLPAGITYKPGSAIYNGEPIFPQITHSEATGETTLVWTLEGVTIGDEISPIYYEAALQANLYNGKSLASSVVISVPEDGREEKYRSNSVTVQVVNMATDSLYKESTQTVYDLGADFTYEIHYGNNTDSIRNGVTILDVLPYNGDGRNSNFHGTYQLAGVTTGTTEIEEQNAEVIKTAQVKHIMDEEGNDTAKAVMEENATLELRTNEVGTEDYAGLLQFQLEPAKKVKSAKLRLVTERLKSTAPITITNFDADWNDASNIAENIDTSRATEGITANLNGVSGKAMFDLVKTVADEGTGEVTYDAGGTKLSDWTTEIDVTNLIESNKEELNLLLSKANTPNGQQTSIFSKKYEQYDKNYYNHVKQVITDAGETMSYLAPTLIIEYESESKSSHPVSIYYTTDDNWKNTSKTAADVNLEEAGVWNEYQKGQVQDGVTAVVVHTDVDSKETLDISVTLRPNAEQQLADLYANNATVTTEAFIDENTGKQSVIYAPKASLVVVSRGLNGRVWLDANGNGRRDSGETFIQGVYVYLMNEDGTAATNILGEPIAQKVTNEKGQYSFEKLAAGNYYVKFVFPDSQILSNKKITIQRANGVSASLNSDAEEEIYQEEDKLYAKIMNIHMPEAKDIYVLNYVDAYEDVGIMPITGSVNLLKTDYNGRDPLAEVSFELYRKNDDGDGASSSEYIGIYTTGQDGMIQVNDLPLGKYYFVEKAALPGYVTDYKSTYEQEIKVEGANVVTEPALVIVKNQRKTGTLRFTKVDQNENPIVCENREERAAFQLKSADGNTVTLYGMIDGTYFTNEAWTADALSNGITDYLGTAYEKSTLITDASGQIVIHGLVWGEKYKLVETKAPLGYQKTTEELEFDVIVNKKGEVVVADGDLTLQNTPTTGNVLFEKVDSTGQLITDGAAKFLLRTNADQTVKVKQVSSGVYELSAEEANNTVTELETSNGKLEIRGLPWNVTYKLVESDAPKGYEVSGEATVFQASKPTIAGEAKSVQIRATQTNINAEASTLELHTNPNDDFAGLLQFPLEAGKKIKSATLRLVTERTEGAAAIGITNFVKQDWNESTTYADLQESIAQSRQSESVAQVNLNSDGNTKMFEKVTSVTDTETGETTYDTSGTSLAAWTTEVDVTGLIAEGAEKADFLLSKLNDVRTDVFSCNYGNYPNGSVNAERYAKMQAVVEAAGEDMSYVAPTLIVVYEDNSYSVINEKAAGSLTIVKTDEDGEAIIGSSATFNLYYNNPVHENNETELLPPVYVAKMAEGYYKVVSQETENALTEVQTSSYTGTVVVEGLPWGAYIMAEAQSPNGYIRKMENIDFVLKYVTETGEVIYDENNDNQADNLTVENTKSTGQIQLSKVDKTGALLAMEDKERRAAFHLLNADDTVVSLAEGLGMDDIETADGVYHIATKAEQNNDAGTISEAVVSAEGRLTIYGLKWGKQYYLKEVKAPEGYGISDEKIPVVLEKDDDGTVISRVDFSLVNRRETGQLTIRKVDDTGELITTSPAKFQVKEGSGQGNVVYFTGGSGHYQVADVSQYLPSDDKQLRKGNGNQPANGKIIEIWRTTETASENANSDFAGLFKFSGLHKEGKQIVSATLKLVTEREKASNAPVDVYLFDNDWAENYTQYADEEDKISDLRQNGTPLTSFIPQNGGYTGKAIWDNGVDINLNSWTNYISLDAGLKGSTADTLSFLVSRQHSYDKKRQAAFYTKDVTEVEANLASYLAENDYTVDDLKPMLTVVYEDVETGTVLPKDTSYVTNEIETNDGIITITGLEWGDYCLKEIEAPDGYVIGNSDETTVSLTYDNQNQQVTAETVSVTNTKVRYDLDIIKISSSVNKDINDETTELTSTKLSGATFTLYSNEACTEKVQDVTADVTTAEGGAASFEGLSEGTYYLKETKAPAGYSLNGTVYKVSITHRNQQADITVEQLTDTSGKKLATPMVLSNDGTFDADNYDTDKLDISKLTTSRYQITFKVADDCIYELPQTGGMGTYGFTIFGVAILMTMLLLSLKDKKRQKGGRLE